MILRAVTVTAGGRARRPCPCSRDSCPVPRIPIPGASFPVGPVPMPDLLWGDPACVRHHAHLVLAGGFRAGHGGEYAKKVLMSLR